MTPKARFRQNPPVTSRISHLIQDHHYLWTFWMSLPFSTEVLCLDVQQTVSLTTIIISMVSRGKTQVQPVNLYLEEVKYEKSLAK